MRLNSRRIAGFSTLALMLAGCGGSSGSQTTANPIKTFKVATAAVYTANAAPVGTVDDGSGLSAARGAVPIIPLATLTSASGQIVVLWGTRDSAGKVNSVREAAYRDGDVTLYARYAANGGILSVLGANAGTNADPALQKNAGSYVVFSQLEEPNLSSITGTGVVLEDGVAKAPQRARATLTGNGISVRAIDENGNNKVAYPDVIAKSVAPRDGGSDPLDGLSTVYQDAANRTEIISGLLKVAGIVVDKPYSTYIENSANFLFIQKLSTSYQNYAAQGYPDASGDSTTPLPYRSDLP